jgi:hypothetical protein
MLRYLCTEGCPMNETACEAAVAARKLEALKLVREQGCPWDARATTAAAVNNDAGMLQYLYEHDCRWDAAACTAAARNSNLSMLQYLRASGCPWSPAAVAARAVESGSVQLVSWLLQQPDIAFDAASMLTAASKGHTAVCELLRAAHIPYSDTVCLTAARGGHCDTLRWLHEHSAPWDGSEVCLAAAESESGSIVTMQYALEHTAAAAREAHYHALLRDMIYRLRNCRRAAGGWCRRPFEQDTSVAQKRIKRQFPRELRKLL